MDAYYVQLYEDEAEGQGLGLGGEPNSINHALSFSPDMAAPLYGAPSDGIGRGRITLHYT